MLDAGTSIDALTAVVVAHPDDEVLGMGGRLNCFARLTLIQLTDGSPRNTSDARRAGFRTRNDYAAAREREARSALATLGLDSCRCIRYALPDQESVFAAREITERLAQDLRGAAFVITHPYEGGHPDHDTAAYAVCAACRMIAQSGQDKAPQIVEFASYHCLNGGIVAGRFFPDSECPELELSLTPTDQARKRAALAQHASQAQVIAWFDPSKERYRRAPRYDFSQPPPPGCALYDLFGWRISSLAWRRAVARSFAVPESRIA